MKKIKVKIIKAALSSYWYNGQIGCEFYVEEHTHEKYKLYKDVTQSSIISKSDCDVIPDDPTPKPEPFELERAKKGELVVTRNGYNGKYTCTITKGRVNPIHVFEINTGPDHNCSWPYCYSSTGFYQSGEGVFEQITSDDENLDLFMAPKEREYLEGWVAVYPAGIISVVYTSQDEAESKNNSADIHKIIFPKP